MTADRKALTVLALGLLIDLAALLGLQTLGGLPDDALVLVILAIAQIGALLFAARRVNRARVWVLCAGIVELAIALFWVIAAPHSSGPPGQHGADLPYGGRWVLLGLITAITTLLAAWIYRDPASIRRVDSGST